MKAKKENIPFIMNEGGFNRLLVMSNKGFRVREETKTTSYVVIYLDKHNKIDSISMFIFDRFKDVKAMAKRYGYNLKNVEKFIPCK